MMVILDPVQAKSNLSNSKSHLTVIATFSNVFIDYITRK